MSDRHAYVRLQGLRLAVVSSLGLMVAGSGLRLVSMEPTAATWLTNIGQILTGIAGCVPYSGASLVSSTWFPAKQRATATSIAAMCCYLGDGIAFILGPLLVTQYGLTETNGSFDLNHRSAGDDWQFLSTSYNMSNISDPYQINRQKSELFRLYLIETLTVAGLFVLAVIYFPAKPPVPPSTSASTNRLQYKDGFLSLMRSPQFWMVCIAFSANGVYLGWASVLGVNLSLLNISQEEAGWIGFYMTIASCVVGVLISRFVDMFSAHTKLIVTGMYLMAALAIAWLTMLVQKYIPFSKAQVYVSCTMIGVFMNGSFPLFLEIACESSYPVAEGITGGCVTMAHNCVTVLFIGLLMITDIGTAWMNWTFMGSVILGIPFIILHKGKRERSSCDVRDR